MNCQNFRWSLLSKFSIFAELEPNLHKVFAYLFYRRFLSQCILFLTIVKLMSNIVEYSTFISGEKENFNKLDQTR